MHTRHILCLCFVPLPRHTNKCIHDKAKTLRADPHLFSPAQTLFRAVCRSKEELCSSVWYDLQKIRAWTQRDERCQFECCTCQRWKRGRISWTKRRTPMEDCRAWPRPHSDVFSCNDKWQYSFLLSRENATKQQHWMAMWRLIWLFYTWNFGSHFDALHKTFWAQNWCSAHCVLQILSHLIFMISPLNRRLSIFHSTEIFIFYFFRGGGWINHTEKEQQWLRVYENLNLRPRKFEKCNIVHWFDGACHRFHKKSREILEDISRPISTTC